MSSQTFARQQSQISRASYSKYNKTFVQNLSHIEIFDTIFKIKNKITFSEII